VYSLWNTFWNVPHIRLYVGLAWLLYLWGVGLWIVLQKREPAATLGWLVSLAVLPYVGFLIYYVFGPQKIVRQGRRRSRWRVSSAASGELGHAAGEVAELQRLVRATTGFGPSDARDVRLLVDGSSKYTALLEDVARAQEHIHLEYYIYAPDHGGTLLRDALVERARAGVKVRLLLDALGSSKASRRFFAPLIEAGGEFAWFHPLWLWRFWRWPWLNLRTHRKLVVIDGRVAFTGGINITDEQDERRRRDAYRDLHLRIEGRAVRALQDVFMDDWAYATHRRDFIGEVVRQAPELAPGPIAMQVLTSGPDSTWETIHRAHVHAIYAARQRVWLATPYFAPGEAASMALTSAALGGLDVRLLVPKMSDSRLVTYCVRSYYEELMAAGVKIYEYGPRMLHTKALLIDDSLAIVGGANFDHRSFRLNFELSLLFDDKAFASVLQQHLDREFARAPRVREDRARPFLSARLPEALARLVSPLL